MEKIKRMFVDSYAADLTKKSAFFYIDQANRRLEALADSDYRESLTQLAYYVTQSF
jgi:geranylgeranyl pyrophosphate synthase